MNQTTTTTPVAQKKGGKFKKFALGFFLVLILIGIAFYFVCGMTYSEGTRTGILTKASKKGYIFKTYEGEINIGGFNQGESTIIPLTIFKFSTTKKQVYDSLEIHQGKKVSLKYRQVIKNFFWQGETDYFVDKVTLEK